MNALVSWNENDFVCVASPGNGRSACAVERMFIFFSRSGAGCPRDCSEVVQLERDSVQVSVRVCLDNRDGGASEADCVRRMQSRS